MQNDRQPSGNGHNRTHHKDSPAVRGDGDAHRSAAERRHGAAVATRDASDDMTPLDAAGTVDPHGDRRQGHQQTENADEEEEPSSPRRNRRGEHALTLGLAATSIAMMVGARGGVAAPGEGSTPPPDVLKPPAERAEEKGVTWDLHVSEHERVDFFVEFLMGRNYDKTRTWLERIGRYGPMIQNELRERGMPEDLLYLTMIESGLNPNAYSRAHAAGLWQFIEETGERYGLEVSPYLDERRDPIESTAAALTYLKEMHDRFNSWYLAAAGYNTGENRVARLMRETTGSEVGSDENYWDIWNRLPSETRDYVPLMLAMGKIAKEPDKYGFHNLEYQDLLQFDEIVVPGATKLSDIARKVGVEPSVIEELNPHLVKKQTPPDRSWAVRIPVGSLLGN